MAGHLTRLLAVSPLAAVAGGENELLRILPVLAARGYRARLAVPGRGELEDVACTRGIPTVILPLGPPERFAPSAFIATALATSRLLRTDVVWLNGLSTQRLVPALALTRTPAVLRVNNPVSEPPAWWRRRRYWSVVRAISVPSQATANECRAAGAPAELIHVMPPPAWGETLPQPRPGAHGEVRPGQQGELRQDPHSELRVGFVGSLESRKGVLDLIQAAGSFLAGHPEATLTLIGRPPTGDDGHYVAELRKAAGAVSGHDRIIFRGHVPNAAREIADFDVLVIPSHAEPLASVTGEAAAVGVPVVATAVGGLPEGVGEVGLIVPPGDPAALADAISALLGDPDRRRELGERALAGSARFDPERFADSLDALLRQAAR